MEYKAWQTPSPKALDAYDLANERKISLHEAVKAMNAEGWIFDGYNDCGEEVYLPPQK